METKAAELLNVCSEKISLSAHTQGKTDPYGHGSSSSCVCVSLSISNTEGVCVVYVSLASVTGK